MLPGEGVDQPVAEARQLGGHKPVDFGAMLPRHEDGVARNQHCAPFRRLPCLQHPERLRELGSEYGCEPDVATCLVWRDASRQTNLPGDVALGLCGLRPERRQLRPPGRSELRGLPGLRRGDCALEVLEQTDPIDACSIVGGLTRRPLISTCATEDLFAQDFGVTAVLGQFAQNLQVHPAHCPRPTRWPVTTASSERYLVLPPEPFVPVSRRVVKSALSKHECHDAPRHSTASQRPSRTARRQPS